ncbi:MAG: hypothetical protein PWQ20_1123 [Thermotogaceae bacterium]|nr:hypothetical protein [Thermotogaceae bacterium]MDN5338053.1 hypothetical protein [Thermotogaceae bacterium]
MSKVEEFRKYREKMNKRIFELGNLVTKRFFSLDSQTYESGALETKYKELMGLVASLVLRCNDCVSYHLIRCVEEGVSDEEIIEAMNIALIVGGSIVIPHYRYAVEFLDELRGRKDE